MLLWRIIAFSALLGVGVSTAHAATYYVATTGSDGAAGSIGAPFRSIQKCVNTMAAGDTCLVNDGTYTSTDGGGIQSAGIVVYIRSGTNASCSTSLPCTVKTVNPLGATVTVPGTQNGGNHGFRISQPGWVVEGFVFTGGTNTGTSASHHGVSVWSGGNDVVIKKNHFDQIARTICSNSTLGNTGIYVDTASRVSVLANLFSRIGRLRDGESGCSTTIYQHDHGVYGTRAGNLTVRRNVCYDTNRGYCWHYYNGTLTNLIHEQNISAGKSSTGFPSGQMRLGGTGTTVTTASIKNNIFYDPSAAPINSGTLTATGVVVSYNLTDFNDADLLTNTNAGITSSNNLYNQTAANIFTNAGSNDFTLKAASPAINAGTNIGLAYNGAAPDIGAFETFVHSTCSVEDGDASTLRITFENNVNPPVLPTSSIAFGTNAITARKAGANDVVTAAVKNGDNRIDSTLTDAIVNGNTVDYSYSTTSGNLTDSALIGGTLNQPFHALTNQSCTNNVGAAASHVFTQARYEFHGKYGTEAAPIIKPDGVAATGAAENFSNMSVVVGGSIRVRFAVTCTTADCPPTGFIPRYQKNGSGGYAVIPDTFGADNIGFCGVGPSPDIPNNGVATTEQLSTSGTFVAGAFVLTSNAIPTVDLELNGKTELEYCFSWDTDATATDYYDIQLYNQDGSTITYTVTPRITLVAPTGGGVAELWDLLLLTMLPLLGRIDANTTKPSSNFAVGYPHVDQVTLDGLKCTSLKTSGTGLKRTVTCVH